MTVSTALSAINTPLVTGSIGLAAAATLPTLERFCVHGHIALPVLKLLNLAAFALSFYATGQPGRLDGAASRTKDENNGDMNGADVVTEFMSIRRGGTLVAPAGWAFAIWAPIFLGELVFTLSSLWAIQHGSTLAVGLLQKASAGFAMAQIFQVLWASTFRPKYFLGFGDTDKKRRIVSTCMSASMLTGIAASLNRAHMAYTSRGPIGSAVDYLVFMLPISLHFGWTTAAALVNWNGNLAVLSDNPKVVAVAGWVSAIAATGVGVWVALSRSAPVYAGVISWALAACADGMKQRLAERDRLVQKERARWFLKDNVDAIFNRKGMYGSQVQKWLCTAGSAISSAVAVFVTIQQRSRDIAP